MAAIITRRTILSVTGAVAGGFTLRRRAGAADLKPARVIYPTAEVAYMAQYVADRQGFFKDAGWTSS